MPGGPGLAIFPAWLVTGNPGPARSVPVSIPFGDLSMRRYAPLALVALLAACPTYDSYKYAAGQDGLMSADDYAAYGPEQAIAMAVGREFGKGEAGSTPDGFAKQADAALTYAKKFPQIKTITADTLGHRLVLTFADGWSTQVTPITDGKSGDETKGLPK